MQAKSIKFNATPPPVDRDVDITITITVKESELHEHRREGNLGAWLSEHFRAAANRAAEDGRDVYDEYHDTFGS